MKLKHLILIIAVLFISRTSAASMISIDFELPAGGESSMGIVLTHIPPIILDFQNEHGVSLGKKELDVAALRATIQSDIHNRYVRYFHNFMETPSIKGAVKLVFFAGERRLGDFSFAEGPLFRMHGAQLKLSFYWTPEEADSKLMLRKLQAKSFDPSLLRDLS